MNGLSHAKLMSDWFQKMINDSRNSLTIDLKNLNIKPNNHQALVSYKLLNPK